MISFVTKTCDTFGGGGNLRHFSFYGQVVTTNHMKTKHKQALQISLSINEKLQVFPCEKCPKQFSSNDVLEKHAETHIQNPCVTCGITFSTQGNLKIHILQKLETEIVEKNKELINCSQCVKYFSKNANLKRHMMEYHNVGNEQKRQE